MKSPKQPKPTAAEIQLQQRQREEMARLDEEENVRLKRGQRSQVGNRRLLSSTASSGGAAGAPASSSVGSGSGGRMTIPRRVGGAAAR